MTAASPFAALLDAAPDAMLVIDEAGRIELVNAQAIALFGYSRDELIGSGVERVIPTRFRATHPGHRQQYFGAPRTRAMGAAGVALYALKKDGSEFPAEVSLSPMNLDGRRLVIAAIRDGTARRKSEEKLRRILEAIPDAMVMADKHGRIILVNARTESMFGYARGELLGQPVETLIPERYRDKHPSFREAYFVAPRVRPMGASGALLFGRKRNGTEFPAEISLSPLETEDETVAIAVIRDVSERLRAEEERATLEKAREAIRLRDEFMSIASHELNTPLTSLYLQVEAMIRRPESRGDASKLRIMRTSVRRLRDLVARLLDISLVTSKQWDLQMADIDLADLVVGVSEQLEHELARASCELRLSLQPVGLVRCDPLRIEEVVTNLIMNALRYGPGHPIEVTLAAVGDRVELSVRDFGIGIARENQERIFERFQRIAPMDLHHRGFGLGLWIVREILECHGGSIRVVSALGEGAVFTASLRRDGAGPQTKD